MLEAVTERLLWPAESCPSSEATPRGRGRSCFAREASPPLQNILFVGAERRGEFAHALRLACRGHDVIAINPRETASAKAFRQGGGKFIRARIEDLPAESCRFDLVCENYPHPSGRGRMS